jgi:hypothetical protein
MLAQPESIVRCDREVFSQNFNRLPHEVQHTLSANPLFELRALAELSQRIATRENPHHPKGDIHVERGVSMGNSRFDPRDWAKIDLDSLVHEIETGQTWIILKHIEREPGYREVFENCICEILDFAGKEILEQIKWFEAILFITSPNRVTDYHIDRECSWLFQIKGDKDIHFFDRADKDVLPDVELEKYWVVDNLSAVYKPQYEPRAMVYHLRPGIGVHSPVNTPHWLQNRDNVSISLSINFQFHEHAWENLFKANYYLRRAGITPSAPGKHPLVDRFKRYAYTVAQDLRRKVKPNPVILSQNEARRQYHRIVEIVGSR